MIDRMKNIVKISWISRSYSGLNYTHWFITDDKYTIEFDGDDIYTATINVNLKINPISNYTEFEFTQECRERAKQIVGSTNYSLLLRNCEHTVNYIYIGTWASLQTSENKIIYNYFRSYMMNNVEKKDKYFTN